MARYIDADSLYCRVKTHTNPYGIPTLDYKSGVKVLEMINQEPTADVVPKSEIERLKNILNSYALQYGTVKDQHAVIEKAKADVAREIFGEIEKYIIGTCCVVEDDVDGIWKKIAELKKKYTENENG